MDSGAVLAGDQFQIPPGCGWRSKTLTSRPAAWSCRAQGVPEGPEPMTATVRMGRSQTWKPWSNSDISDAVLSLFCVLLLLLLLLLLLVEGESPSILVSERREGKGSELLLAWCCSCCCSPGRYKGFSGEVVTGAGRSVAVAAVVVVKTVEAATTRNRRVEDEKENTIALFLVQVLMPFVCWR